MRVVQTSWNESSGWSQALPPQADLILVFGARKLLEKQNVWEKVASELPSAIITGCSTAGEIRGTEVLQDSLVATCISFEKTQLRSASASSDIEGGSFSAGKLIAQELDDPDLKHILVLSDGINVNGSELVAGIHSFNKEVLVSGGLAGDGELFERTVVVQKDGVSDKIISAVGFYGNYFVSSAASFGGWDTFGPEREVTRSAGNVLFELDGKSALELYKEYLGDHAAELPASGLLFPLFVSGADGGLVRTILGVDEKAGSITFAGDVPQGHIVQLMRANLDRLIKGAEKAAELAVEGVSLEQMKLGLLISCVGRKMVLKQSVEEEIEGVKQVFGENIALTGFYSYGELSPSRKGEPSLLHNQTMTISLFGEK